MRKLRSLLLVTVLLLGLVLRFWGIYWGAPQRIDLHPDEVDHVMTHALSISLSDPDPKFLNYPSFLMYSIAVTNGLFRRLGLIDADWQSYILGRSIVASFGTATSGAAFLLAEELGAPLAGSFLSGLWVALLPLHVWESHVAVTDVVMTFWIVVALLASARLVRTSRPRDYAFAGVAIGLAVASKYTAALAVIAPVSAVAVARRGFRDGVRGLAIVGIAAAASCIAATPYSFYHFGELWRAMAFENRHVHGHHAGFSLPAIGPQYHKYVYQLAAAWPFSMGLALYASAAAGTLWVLSRLRGGWFVVVSFAVLFFAVTGGWTFTPLRYYLPILVVGAILAGCWQGTWLTAVSFPRRALAFVAAVVTLAYTSIFAVQTTARFREDTRMQAARWLEETLPAGSSLLLCGDPRYMAKPLDRRTRVHFTNEAVIGRIKDVGRTFDMVEITSLLYSRWYRHGHPALRPAYEGLRSERGSFRLVKRFETDFLNRDLYRRLDPMFEGYFVSPTLEFYEPKTHTAAAGAEKP